MSGLLLCNKQSDVPYYIADLDINVYSIEEISYFLYNHIYLVGTDFFSKELAEYIKKELDLPELANELIQSIDNNVSFNDLVLLILRESDYYNENEYKEFANKIANLDANSYHKRLKAKGDLFYNCNKYMSAIKQYLKIMEMTKEAGVSNQFYASILNNIGIIYIKVFLYNEAEKYFKQSYDLYPNEESLKRLVLTNLIQNNDEDLLKNIRKYPITDELLKECRQEFIRVKEEAQDQDEFQQLKELLDYDGKQDIETYYKGLLDTIDKWKSDYRELML